LFSSHIDTTGTQALVDTKNEVERWADRPIEFHFASILSPWTRRSLVAAGFGVSSSGESGVRPEIAPVTRYHDEFIADPQHSTAHPENTQAPQVCDEEAIVESTAPSSSRSSDEYSVDTAAIGSKGIRAPLVQTSTPFFHFDLVAAVRAAESATPSCISYNTFPEKE
jgi:solute carrier family 26 (sodium-independent sulfate anion transporter), member 11